MPINFFDSAPANQIPDFSQLGALGKIGLVLQNVADPSTVPKYQQALQQQTQQQIVNQARQSELDRQSALGKLYQDPSFLSLPVDQQLLRQAQITGDGSALANYQASQQITPYQRLHIESDRNRLAFDRQKLGVENSITTNNGLSINSPLVSSVINAESGGNPNAVSPAGAQGLMQIMPDTARQPGYGVTPLQGWDGVNPMTASPEEQVRFGTDYLNAMIAKNGGNTSLGLASYNAGPGAVEQYGGIPPYKETQDYVNKINKNIAGSMAPASAQPLYKGGKPYTEGLKDNYQWALNPDGSQVAIKIPGTAPSKDENDQKVQSDAKGKFDETLTQLQDYYDELAKVGEIRTQNQGTLANIGDYFPNATGFFGAGPKAVGDFYGTPGSAIREKIDATKSLAAAQYIQAAGLTSGQTNSVAEQERFLSTLGGYNKNYEANQSALANLSKSYGRGTVKPRDIKNVVGSVNGYTVRKK